MSGPIRIEPVEWVVGDPNDRDALAIRKCFGFRLPYEPMWKVKRAAFDGPVLAKNGGWEYDPLPSSRDEAFYRRCRFDSFEEAIAAAMNAINSRRKQS